MASHRSSRARTYPLLGFAGTLLCTLACNQVLGIEDATLASAGSGSSQGGGNSAGQENTGGTPAGLTGGVGGSAGGINGGSTSTGGAAAGGDPVTNGGTTALAGEGGEAGDGPLGEAGQDTGPPASLCEQYCVSLEENCAEDASHYNDREQCLTICAMFPNTETAPANANTLACRLRRAKAAGYSEGDERRKECRSAGPGGEGFCGSNCEGLCSVTMGTCDPESSPFDHYETYDACMADCAGTPDLPDVVGNEVVTGNSVQCQLYHAVSAAMTSPEEHCTHAMGRTICE